MKNLLILILIIFSLNCFAYQHFYIFTTAVQPDGKILVGGFFQQIGGYYRNNIARLNEDGSLDHLFVADVNDAVSCIAIQEDGKIIIGGNFKKVNGRERKYLARLMPDGTTDPSFYAEPNGNVFSILMKKNGKFLITGLFKKVSDYERKGIAMIDQAGMVDTSFKAKIDGYVYAMTILEDENIIIGGHFKSVNDVPKNNIAKINNYGQLDLNFKTAIDSYVYSILTMADGSILVGGFIERANGKRVNNLIKIFSNGELDENFKPEPNNTVSSIFLQSEGKILVGGHFLNISGVEKSYIARLFPDGSVDETFNLKPNNYISEISSSSDGKIYVSGGFTEINGFKRKKIAQIFEDGSIDENFNANTYVKWIQVGTHSKGGLGSFWITDFYLENIIKEPSKAVVYMHFSNGDIADLVIFKLKPEEEMFIEDFYGRLKFNVSGAIEIISSQEVETEAKIYNDSDKNSCQIFKGYSEDKAIWCDKKYWLLNLKENSFYRTNLHLTNIGRENAIVEIILFSSEENFLSKFIIELLPGEYKQFPQIFKYYGGGIEIEDGALEILNYSSQPILASASVIENSTNNGIVILPVEE